MFPYGAFNCVVFYGEKVKSGLLVRQQSNNVNVYMIHIYTIILFFIFYILYIFITIIFCTIICDAFSKTQRENNFAVINNKIIYFN